MADYEGILGEAAPKWLSTAQESLRSGDAKAALKVAQEARDGYRSQGDKKREGAALIMMANASVLDGDFDASTRAASEALNNFQVTKDPLGESAALVAVANIGFYLGQYEDAIASADDAANLAESCGATKQMAYSKQALANAAMARVQGKENFDPEAAAKALLAAQGAATAFRDVDEKGEMGQALALCSQAYLLTGNSNMALAKAKEAQKSFQADKDVSNQARVIFLICMAYEKEGSLDAAIKQMEEAAQLFKSIGDDDSQEEAYALMEHYSAKRDQDQLSFTKNVLERADKREEKGPMSHRFVPFMGASALPDTIYMPPHKGTILGPSVTLWMGFMGRSASTAAPKKSSGDKGGGGGTSELLYNCSWK